MLSEEKNIWSIIVYELKSKLGLFDSFIVYITILTTKRS